jgi:hypothetical protein
MYIQEHNAGARSCNHCCSGKAVSIACSECVFVAFVIQHAMRMRHITLSSVVGPAVQYFSALSHKRHGFGNDVIKHQMCFDFL